MITIEHSTVNNQMCMCLFQLVGFEYQRAWKYIKFIFCIVGVVDYANRSTITSSTTTVTTKAHAPPTKLTTPTSPSVASTIAASTNSLTSTTTSVSTTVARTPYSSTANGTPSSESGFLHYFFEILSELYFNDQHLHNAFLCIFLKPMFHFAGFSQND